MKKSAVAVVLATHFFAATFAAGLPDLAGRPCHKPVRPQRAALRCTTLQNIFREDFLQVGTAAPLAAALRACGTAGQRRSGKPAAKVAAKKCVAKTTATALFFMTRVVSGRLERNSSDGGEKLLFHQVGQ